MVKIILMVIMAIMIVITIMIIMMMIMITIMIMILQALHFGEPFACEKVEFCESAQILMRLHSMNPCLIYRGQLRFQN